MKNATAKSIAAIQMSISPMKIIVRNAPMSSSKPAVANKPVPLCTATSLRERRIKNAAIIAKTQTMTRISRNPVSKGISAEGSMLVLGVMFCNDCQLPSQPG